MERYKNLNGNSGVVAFEIGVQDIKIKFHDGSIYLYDYSIPGSDAVEKLKELARKGYGLSGYISTFVRERYAAKLR